MACLLCIWLYQMGCEMKWDASPGSIPSHWGSKADQSGNSTLHDSCLRHPNFTFAVCACRDLGAHIDGFVAVTAHTLVVQETPGAVSGKAADLIQAAQTCAEVAMRMIKPGKPVSAVPEQLEKVVEAYGCSLVEGVMTHQMKQFVIDGNKVVLNKVRVPV